MRRRAAAATLAAACVAAATASATTRVQGSIAGPVTSTRGRTFTVRTALSPTGSSRVSTGSEKRITEQVAAPRADLKRGDCVTATGTRRGAAVAAARISLTTPASGGCGSPFRSRNSRSRPRGTFPRRAGAPTFRRPADVAFAIGSVVAVRGADVTVKGFRGTTTVSLSKATQVSKIVSARATAVKRGLRAFVYGTSADHGVTVTAQTVSLRRPVGGSCPLRRGGP